MEDESGKNKALGAPRLTLRAGRRVVGDVKALHVKALPWRQLVDYRAVSLPTGAYDGLRRVRRNTNDFGYNYFLVVLALTATCLVLNPSLLLPIFGILVAWLYVLRVRAADVVVAGKTFGVHAQRIGLVFVAIAVLHFGTRVSALLFSVLFWGVLGCATHAVLITPNADDDAPTEGGFVNYFTATAASAYGGVKHGVQAVGVPSQWFSAADAAFSKLGWAV